MKKIINISLWTLPIIFLLITMGFVNHEQRRIFCTSVDIRINYDHKNFFVEKGDVLSMIAAKGIKLAGVPLSVINFENIETLINTNPSIAKAEVYSTIAGEIKIDIVQRKPIIRIMTDDLRMNFYIDENGREMPLSSKHTSKVLIANGNIKTSMLDDLFKLAKYVDKNNFWKSQIQQIYINLDEEIELIPRVGRHKIILGDVSDMDEKFKKLMIFYKRGLNYTGWNKYKTINLKFKNQIVCTKI